MKPPDATHWSTRTITKAMGVSNATVSRILAAPGLQPHRMNGFKLSQDKRFVEKLTDVVGVYLNLPDKAVVLCLDDKSTGPGPGPNAARIDDEERTLWDDDA